MSGIDTDVTASILSAYRASLVSTDSTKTGGANNNQPIFINLERKDKDVKNDGDKAPKTELKELEKELPKGINGKIKTGHYTVKDGKKQWVLEMKDGSIVAYDPTTKTAMQEKTEGNKIKQYHYKNGELDYRSETVPQGNNRTIETVYDKNNKPFKVISRQEIDGKTKVEIQEKAGNKTTHTIINDNVTEIYERNGDTPEVLKFKIEELDGGKIKQTDYKVINGKAVVDKVGVLDENDNMIVTQFEQTEDGKLKTFKDLRGNEVYCRTDYRNNTKVLENKMGTLENGNSYTLQQTFENDGTTIKRKEFVVTDKDNPLKRTIEIEDNDPDVRYLPGSVGESAEFGNKFLSMDNINHKQIVIENEDGTQTYSKDTITCKKDKNDKYPSLEITYTIDSQSGTEKIITEKDPQTGKVLKTYTEKTDKDGKPVEGYPKTVDGDGKVIPGGKGDRADNTGDDIANVPVVVTTDPTTKKPTAAKGTVGGIYYNLTYDDKGYTHGIRMIAHESIKDVCDRYKITIDELDKANPGLIKEYSGHKYIPAGAQIIIPKTVDLNTQLNPISARAKALATKNGQTYREDGRISEFKDGGDANKATSFKAQYADNGEITVTYGDGKKIVYDSNGVAKSGTDKENKAIPAASLPKAKFNQWYAKTSL